VLAFLDRFFSPLAKRSFPHGPEFAQQIRAVLERSPNRPVVLTLYASGIIDFMMIRHFLRQELGKDRAPALATRVYEIFFLGPLTALRYPLSYLGLCKRPAARIRRMVDEMKSGRIVVLNFETRDRRKPFETPMGESELLYLLNEVPQFTIVPVTIVWQRSTRRGMFDPQADFPLKVPRWLLAPLIYTWNIFLGDPYIPTATRKLALLLLGYRRGFLTANAEIPSDSPDELPEFHVKNLRRQALIKMQQEKRVVLGPTFRSTRFIGETLFRNPDFGSFIKRLSVEEGVPERTLFRRAEKIFSEMSSRYSYSVIEILSKILRRVFSTIYDGVRINPQDIERLRGASKNGALVFVPCHKSYIDFLILSYVLNINDISPPHVIAGINMNFWPFGPIFKGGGAIFIRRSFRGNRLYQEVLRRYIATLLNSHINLEFFIEGMRSRNGKLAPPKYGIIKNVVESYLKGEIKDRVQIVPVSICYDRVTEDRAHRRELEGGEKVKESFFNAMKSMRVLFKNFGSVHLNFSDIIPLDKWVTEAAQKRPRTDIEEARIRLEVQKLAFEICHRINRSTPVTSVGLVAAALLAKPEGSMSRMELDFWLDIMKTDLTKMKTPLAQDLEVDFGRACKRGLARLIDDGVVEKFYTGSEGQQLGLKVPEKFRVAGLYYKNTVIHAFLEPAILGLATDPKTHHASDEELLELRSLLEFEFFFPKKSEYISEMRSLGDSPHARYYAYLLDDVLENVQLGLMALKEMPNLIIQSKDWRTRLMKRAKGFMDQKLVIRTESVNTQSFQAFMEMAKNRGWLISTKADSDLLKPGEPAAIDQAIRRVQHYRSRLKSWETNKEAKSHEEGPRIIT
jgi:1-acyl-sn-glycerol-3-phosphate acyltransferase